MAHRPSRVDIIISVINSICFNLCIVSKFWHRF